MILTFFALIVSLISASADIAVYRQTVIYKRTGNGVVQMMTVTGYELIDEKIGWVVSIGVHTNQHRFDVNLPNTTTVGNVDGGPGRRFQVWAENIGEIGSIHWKGLNVRTDLVGVKGTNIVYNIPRTLTASGKVIFHYDSELVLTELTGTYTYNAADTKAVNYPVVIEMEAAVEHFRTILVKRGFTE